jgi:hypothetical protein
METTALSMFNSTVKYEGDDIFIQPFCDFFGIDYLNQKKAINRNALLKTSMSKKTSMLLFGDERERIALTKTGFITWILQLRCQIVHPNLQEKLMQYQSLIFEFMFGSIHREENARINYARLKKLKRLKRIINTEISKCENDIQGYLQNKFVQAKLEL